MPRTTNDRCQHQQQHNSAEMAGVANAISKVKVLVVGDSGVGKSSLVHLICHNKPLSNSSWTIGCGVEVKLHEFHEGTPQQRSYFVELWDIGGNNSHKIARHVFYSSFHGIILIHDLTNRKSQQNLRRWLVEVMLKEPGLAKGRASSAVEEFDAEQFGGFSQVPVLVVGTKQDQVAEVRTNARIRTSSIADECSSDEMFVNCLEVKSIAPGSSNAVKLSRFFDKVIERQLTTRPEVGISASYLERESSMVRRNKTSSSYYIS
ncbi:rab-like protein 3 isoform X2 [Oratosquilla oratoria]|uniref:rab-like protein 3 isoform X2 n=1 Tax=Oratosquilla oratoria TaxID=337810 RepID=UPI003F75D780